MFKKFTIALLLCLSLLSYGICQDGIETGSTIWNWSEPQEYHNAVVRLSSELGSGTATVIKTEPKDEKYDTAYLITAAHMFCDTTVSESIVYGSSTITYYDGTQIKNCNVVQIDKENDIAIVWGLCPKGLKPIKVADKPIASNEKVEYLGLGGKSDVTKNGLRHFYGISACVTTPDRLISNTYFIHGDSGGAALNENHELVGVVSGGLYLCTAKLKQNDWEKIVTYPALCCNLNPIKKLLEKSFPSDKNVNN